MLHIIGPLESHAFGCKCPKNVMLSCNFSGRILHLFCRYNLNILNNVWLFSAGAHFEQHSFQVSISAIIVDP